MALNTLAARLPPYATDVGVNLARLAAETTLSAQQKWGCFLACAFSLGARDLVDVFESEAGGTLPPPAQSAARAAATIMAMNTVYYGAVNLLQNHDYRSASPDLSMAVLSKPGVDKIDFELWSFAVSALSNCEACLNSHEAELHKRGVSLEMVQTALRIASVVNALHAVLRGEKAA